MKMEKEWLEYVYKGVYTMEEQTASSIGPNEAVHVATLYYYNIYLIETKGQQSGRFFHTHPYASWS